MYVINILEDRCCLGWGVCYRGNLCIGFGGWYWYYGGWLIEGKRSICYSWVIG